MYGYVNRLKIIFLIIFGTVTLATVIYQFGWRLPEDRCNARGAWWDWRARVCATPVPLYVLTGKGGPDAKYVPRAPAPDQGPVAAGNQPAASLAPSSGTP